MKRALLLLLIVPLHGQQQTVNNEPFPSARTKINANFTDLYTNKAGNRACPANQYAIQTTTAGVVCASLTSGQLVTALGFTPAPTASPTFTGVLTDGTTTIDPVTGITTPKVVMPAGTPAEIGGACETSAAATLPAAGEYTEFLDSGNSCKLSRIDHSRTVTVIEGGSGGVWGSITGTLSSQSDLNTAFGLKAASNASTTVNGQTCALGSTCSVAVNNLTAGAVPTGSTVAIPAWLEIQGGVCQNVTASAPFSLETSNAATAICITGANTQLGAAQFTSGKFVQGHFILPDDWTSVLAVEFRFLSETAASTGNAVWSFTYACIASTGASVNPSFASVQTVSIAALANNLNNVATLTTPTISGCSAGQRFFYRLGLDASTTAAGNEDLLSVRFKIKRTVTAL